MCLASTVHLWSVDKLYTSTWQRYLFFFCLLSIMKNSWLLGKCYQLIQVCLIFCVAEVWESPKSRRNKLDLVHVDLESSASTRWRWPYSWSLTSVTGAACLCPSCVFTGEEPGFWKNTFCPLARCEKVGWISVGALHVLVLRQPTLCWVSSLLLSLRSCPVAVGKTDDRKKLRLF